jgi:hypothetical protein
LPLPQKLDSHNNQSLQQNIASPIEVSAQQDPVFETDLAMQNKVVNLEQVTFVLPQKLGSLNSSNASLTITDGPAVVLMASNPSESRNDGNQPTPNPEKEKLPDQDPQGKPEKNLGCFNGVFFRTLDRFRSKSSSRPNCNFLKFLFASCLGSSRSREMDPKRSGERD